MEATAIPESDNGQYPFWSPDSRFIAFFASGKLKKVSTTGGQVITLCRAANARGGTWGSAGTILFTPHWRRQPIFRVPADGGEPVAVTQLDATRNETTHRWPWFLPDGRHFLFLAGSHIVKSTSGDNAIYLGSLDSDETRLLFRARSAAVFAAGQILFSRGGSLVARPFEPDRLAFTGDERTLVTGVQYERTYFQGVFGVSAAGLLAYHAGNTRTVSNLVWMDRDGGITPRWANGGNELFFIAPDHTLMEVGVSFTPELTLEAPRPLFDSEVRIDDTACYDVTPDGKRFLINRLPANQGAASITLISGWTSLLPVE
ncbi:MAG: TolB family protein [Acidobacteriota bacterium]